jgi:hypothetical protein
MSEIYPMRAPGEYAGTGCDVKSCPRYARWYLTPYQMGEVKPILTCGTHLGVSLKGLRYQHQKAIVIQEIPGNWLKGSSEYAMVNGEVQSMHMTADDSPQRKKRVAA